MIAAPHSLPKRLELDQAEAHVWSVSLDAHLGLFDPLHELLAPDEAERAARFRFELHRRRFAIGRGLVRVLLSRYVGGNPHDVVFDYNPFGKPLLGGGTLAFNVSHSGGRMLVGVSPGFEIGVDLEALNGDALRHRVAEQFFSRREVAELYALDEQLRPSAFLTCWTRKEAFIKAHGEGLSLPLADFDVTLTPGVPPALLRTRWAAAEAGEWALHDLRASGSTRYAAALAVHAHDVRVLEREAHLSHANLVND